MNVFPEREVMNVPTESSRKSRVLVEVEEIHIHCIGLYLLIQVTIGVDALHRGGRNQIATEVEKALHRHIEYLRRVSIHYHPSRSQAGKIDEEPDRGGSRSPNTQALAPAETPTVEHQGNDADQFNEPRPPRKERPGRFGRGRRQFSHLVLCRGLAYREQVFAGLVGQLAANRVNVASRTW